MVMIVIIQAIVIITCMSILTMIQISILAEVMISMLLVDAYTHVVIMIIVAVIIIIMIVAMGTTTIVILKLIIMMILTGNIVGDLYVAVCYTTVTVSIVVEIVHVQIVLQSVAIFGGHDC